MSVRQKLFFTNQAFSQQSEFIQKQQILARNIRQSPVGAQANNTAYCEQKKITERFREKNNSFPDHLIVDDGNVDGDGDVDGDYDQQEFYEEMLVDDHGTIKEKKILVVHSQSPPKLKNHNSSSQRYEYISMEKQPEQPVYYTTKTRKPSHRYEYIPDNDVEENDEKIEERIVELSPQQQQKQQKIILRSPKRSNYSNVQIQNSRKLESLLATPRNFDNSNSTQIKDPFSVSPGSYQQKQQQQRSSRQRLDYVLAPNNSPSKMLIAAKNGGNSNKKILGSPQLLAGYYNQNGANLSVGGTGREFGFGAGAGRPVSTQLTLAVASLMMLLCGAVTAGLCFYMVSILGRLYYLDFGIMGGVTCFVLGLLGFRTRNCYWLPNRNYISGYIVLSVFSLLTCVGLLVLLVVQPRAGTPLADMTSGAVCGLSGLSLILACAGTVTSYCCKYPPPDNRVQHCVQGFTV